MFGFGRKKEKGHAFDADAVVTQYEGSVSVGDYVPENLGRAGVNDLSNPYHLMVPHGLGKITYTIDDEIIEQYEGEFEGGLYHGSGKLIYRDKVVVGKFENGEFVG